MLAIIKKVAIHSKKELSVYAAVGHIVRVGEEEKECLEECEYIGNICLDECRGSTLFGGNINVRENEHRVEFELRKPAKRNQGIGGLQRSGNCFADNGTHLYTLEEKLQEQNSFWIFKSGYVFYEMCHQITGKRYVIKDICFAADMHYYYIYDEKQILQAAIYKPYRKPGEDEYHVYANGEGMAEIIFFFVAYIDFFHYSYNKESVIDREYYTVYEDDKAYNISCDELLKLYDENFTKRVIRNA